MPSLPKLATCRNHPCCGLHIFCFRSPPVSERPFSCYGPIVVKLDCSELISFQRVHYFWTAPSSCWLLKGPFCNRKKQEQEQLQKLPAPVGNCLQGKRMVKTDNLKCQTPAATPAEPARGISSQAAHRVGPDALVLSGLCSPRTAVALRPRLRAFHVAGCPNSPTPFAAQTLG